MSLRLDTFATDIDVAGQQLTVRTPDGSLDRIGYDELIVGTGALASSAGIAGVDQLGPEDGVHVLHSMGDTFALERYLDERDPQTAIIVGAGYVGLEMAEALTVRGLQVTQLQRGPEVLSTLDPELGALVHTELTDHGVEVLTHTTVASIEKTTTGLAVHADHNGSPVTRTADVVLLVVGVKPNTDLLARAGATLGAGSAVVVDEAMRTGLPHVYAAGDGVTTHHRLLGVTYLPLGTTAHKQGRVAGENALGGDARFAGSVGTQVVKVFDLVASRTGLREHEALAAGFAPATTTAVADDHKRYYPARNRSLSASPATPATDASSARNSSAASAPRPPSASTPTRPPCSLASPLSRSPTSTSPTHPRSAPPGMPCKSPPRPGPAPTPE